MGYKSFVVLCGAALTLASVGTGCNGKVREQEQTQTVRPDGTAVQEQTRIRETPSGTVVKETATKERKVIEPGPGVSDPDPTMKDPGKSGE